MDNGPDSSLANELLSARCRRRCARLPFSHSQELYRYARRPRLPYNELHVRLAVAQCRQWMLTISRDS